MTIPSTVKAIEEEAFSSCEKLADITLADPDSVIDIHGEAFSDTYWYNRHPEGFIRIRQLTF